jgi:hypothetical protein
VVKKTSDETPIQIEKAQEAIRESIERAHELICEAKQRIQVQEVAESGPDRPEPGGIAAVPPTIHFGPRPDQG